MATVDALHRHGEVLAMHAAWDAAAAAYSKALSRDATRLDTLLGRARAYEALQRFPEAIADARRAVALIGDARRDTGQRSRNRCARARAVHGRRAQRAGSALARWRFAFERGDVGAGYLLRRTTGATIVSAPPTCSSTSIAASRPTRWARLEATRLVLWRREFARRVELERPRAAALVEDPAMLAHSTSCAPVPSRSAWRSRRRAPTAPDCRNATPLRPASSSAPTSRTPRARSAA
jgi:tetratricopeptide (TPR) repeat protein